MWLHITLFGILAGVWAGWKTGWLPFSDISDTKGKQMFFLIGAAGNLLGLVLTFQALDVSLGDDFRLPRTEDAYSEDFMLSIGEDRAARVTVEIPEIEKEEEQHAQQQPDEEESRRIALEEAIRSYNDKKQDAEWYYLPPKLDGQRLTWERSQDNSGTMLAALFFAAAAAALLLKGQERQKELIRRQEALLMDYPELVMKFTMLVQAGMTVRKTFQKMARDYQRRTDPRPRPAYEEIITICHEMDSGVSESEAYYRFGERCGQVKYKTFSTLLEQNLHRGSRQLVQMLEKESLQAWEDRKRKARVLGEAAATKLLLPMILMMGVVMALVMVPAVLTFYAA